VTIDTAKHSPFFGRPIESVESIRNRASQVARDILKFAEQSKSVTRRPDEDWSAYTQRMLDETRHHNTRWAEDLGPRLLEIIRRFEELGYTHDRLEIYQTLPHLAPTNSLELRTVATVLQSWVLELPSDELAKP